jgi:hypothetical protein
MRVPHVLSIAIKTAITVSPYAISQCCPIPHAACVLRVVVVTGSTFEILIGGIFPASVTACLFLEMAVRKCPERALCVNALADERSRTDY